VAKWAFEDNVPKVRPRLRLGKSAEEVVDAVTEPPPVRPRDEVPSAPEAAEPEVEPRRRSLVRDIIATADESAAELSPPSEVVTPPALEEIFEPEALAAPSESAPVEKAEETEEPVAAVAESVAVEPIDHVSHIAVPAVGEATSIPETNLHEEAPDVEEVAAPAPLAPKPAPVAVVDEATIAARRATLKRRAAGLGAISDTPVPLPSGVLDELDALESTAELAVELERALSTAAEANEQLRGDLNAALDDLARATAEAKRLHERVERLDAESRDRNKVVQDLMRELELLEGERDSALVQAADAQLEIDGFGDKMLALERRIHELERGLAESQARNKRFEEAMQAHAAQRAALRAEAEAMRRERDSLLSRNVELERERDELGRSRKALDEVHRALTEARMRAQRIKAR
jgi:hypothetical protein